MYNGVEHVRRRIPNQSLQCDCAPGGAYTTRLIKFQTSYILDTLLKTIG